MFKKLSALGLALLLTFFPVMSLTAETLEDEPNAESDVELSLDVEEQSNEDSEAISNEDGSDVTHENEVDANEPNDEAVENVVEETEATYNISETDEDIVNEADVSATEEENVEESEVAIEEADEEFDLQFVFGRAEGTITYDFNKGYYVLDLRAGINNFFSGQQFNDKWIAFALPDGVFVPDVDDVPTGVAPVQIANKNGIAVKVPDVAENSSSSRELTIPLSGFDQDNDPHFGIYLLNVDVEQRTYEVLGQLRGTSEIDFSVMEETPTLDLYGTMTGNTTFDEEKGYHFLQLDVTITDETDDRVNELYVGFPLPEGVVVINNEDTPQHAHMVRQDDTTYLVTKLLENSEEISYRIPVMGVSDEVVESSTIAAYRQVDGIFQLVGQFDGYVEVDFSDMDFVWDFSAKSQIVRDYPSLPDNTFAMNFAFKVGNMTIDEVDEVKLEFHIPEEIQVQEPDNYEVGDIPDSLRDFIDDINVGTGNLDVTWDGNVATVLLGDIGGISGYQGFFTAFGETNLNINELDGLEVVVTLYQNGQQLVEEMVVPFEIVNYDGEHPGGDDQRPGDEPGGDDGRPGDDGRQRGGDDGQTGDDRASGDDTSGTDDSSDGTTVTIEDGDDQDERNGTSETTDKDGETLPKTATNMYTMLLIGTIVLLVGVTFLFLKKRTVS